MGYDLRRLRGYHPKACTCVDCVTAYGDQVRRRTPPVWAKDPKSSGAPKTESSKPPPAHPRNCQCGPCKQRRVAERNRQSRQGQRQGSRPSGGSSSQCPDPSPQTAGPSQRPPQTPPPRSPWVHSPATRPNRHRRGSFPHLWLGFLVVAAGVVAAILFINNPDILAPLQGGEPVAVVALAPTEEPRTNTPAPTPQHGSGSTVVSVPTSVPSRSARTETIYLPSPTPFRVATTRVVPNVVTMSTPSLEKRYLGGALLDPVQIEEWVLFYTNEAREGEGLGPLQHDVAISDIARAHSGNMATSGIFAHKIGGDGPTDRALAAGYDCRADVGGGRYTYGLSENITKHPRVQNWQGTTSWGQDQVAAHRVLQRRSASGQGYGRGLDEQSGPPEKYLG